MKILTLIGSPRKNGNTVFIASALLKHLKAGTFTNEQIFLHALSISPCNDCRACKSGNLICTVHDDLEKIYPKIEAADLLIFGTPIYWYTPTAQMKILIDRFRPYYKSELLKNKKAIVLMPAGVGRDDCDLTIRMFERFFEALQIDFLGYVAAKAFDIGDIPKNEVALKDIENLSHQIAGSCKD